MVSLMRLPSSTHCVLHHGPISPASWAIWVAIVILDYAANAYLSAPNTPLITLFSFLAFNLFCSLITVNSSRTRNLISPNILSNPKRPHIFCCKSAMFSFSLSLCYLIITCFFSFSRFLLILFIFFKYNSKIYICF